MKWVWERYYKESERLIELFKLNRSYEGSVKKLNSERSITNNKDLPCAVVDDDYIDVDDEKHLPAVRISALVTDDGYSVEMVNYLRVTENTNGDQTENTNVDLAYDKIIKGDNPGNYYYGIMEKQIYMVIILTIVI